MGACVAALERAWDDRRSAGQALELPTLAPVEAIRRLVDFTFDDQEANPACIRRATLEDIHQVIEFPA